VFFIVYYFIKYIIIWFYIVYIKKPSQNKIRLKEVVLWGKKIILRSKLI